MIDNSIARATARAYIFSTHAEMKESFGQKRLVPQTVFGRGGPMAWGRDQNDFHPASDILWPVPHVAGRRVQVDGELVVPPPLDLTYCIVVHADDLPLQLDGAFAALGVTSEQFDRFIDQARVRGIMFDEHTRAGTESIPMSRWLEAWKFEWDRAVWVCKKKWA